MIFPPFCIPTSLPYSVAHFAKSLKGKNFEFDFLDLNLEFNAQYTNPFTEDLLLEDYETIARGFMSHTNDKYKYFNDLLKNNSEEMNIILNKYLDSIMLKNPDYVGFSCFYNQQIFYAKKLSKLLQQKGVKTLLGGPAVDESYKNDFTFIADDETGLRNILKHEGIELEEEKQGFETNIFDLNKYFTPKPVLSVKTSNGCYHNKCAFCTHSKNECYGVFDLNIIVDDMVKSKQKYFQFVDDMISPARFKQLSEKLIGKNFIWSALAKPNKEFTLELLELMHSAGCRLISWGVESGSQKVLDLMNKKTTVEECTSSLNNAGKVGIKNQVYVMFGFPGETKEDALETIKFIETNSSVMHLITTSVFGLQEGSEVFKHPENYGIINLEKHERTVLCPKYTFEITNGMTTQQASKFRRNHIKQLRNINKCPASMSYFKDHLLVYYDLQN